MALSQKSLFLYGFQVTEDNCSIDFRSVSLETPRTATLTLGYYSLSSLASEIARAMGAADTARTFTVSVNRSMNGGLENRVTISTSGAFLQILGSTGPNLATSVLPLIGFPLTDRSGATSYAGNTSAGTSIVPRYYGFNFESPDFKKQIMGAVNVSASGQKEAVVYSIQYFFQVEFKYISGADVVATWAPFIDWLIQQREFEFTPQIGSPDTFYVGTLDKTEADGKGLGHEFKEMLPTMPGLYRTGLLTFRQSQ